MDEEAGHQLCFSGYRSAASRSSNLWRGTLRDVEGLLTPLILFVAALVQGFLGFGFGIIAMGGLSLGPGLLYAAGLVNLMGLIQTGTMAAWMRRGVRWPLVRRMVIGSALGVALGLFLLGTLDLRVLQFLLGLLIAAIAAWNLSPWKRAGAPSKHWDLPAGFASGLLNGLFNTGGPPLVAHIYRHPEPPDVLKGTVQMLLLCTVVIRLPGAWLQGLFPAPVLAQAAFGVVPVLLGTLTGIALARRIDPTRFRRASWTALGMLGLWIAWVS